MAKTRTSPEERDEDTAKSLNKKRLEREPSEMHKLLANWIEEQTGYEPDLKTVQLVSTMRNEFRRTSTYLEFREREKAEKAEKASENGDEDETDEDGEEKPATKSRKKSSSSGKKSSGGSRRKKAAEEALDDA